MKKLVQTGMVLLIFAIAFLAGRFSVDHAEGPPTLRHAFVSNAMVIVTDTGDTPVYVNYNHFYNPSLAELPDAFVCFGPSIDKCQDTHEAIKAEIEAKVCHDPSTNLELTCCNGTCDRD
jgi:hypothetical protein